MAKVNITAPNPDYNGISAGVRFTDGKATIDSEKQLAALEYFSRHRFGISEEVESKSDPALNVSKQPAPIDVLNAESVAKLTKEQINALAVENGITDDLKGTKPEMAAQLAGLVAAKRAAETANPSQVASGPVGAQHNTGHDGANPDAQEPQQTPADVPGI